MRLAVISPFVDRRHGTERALAELLERLAYTYGCEIDLYSQRVEDLRMSNANVSESPAAGRITWRRVPSALGPHLVQFVTWVCLNGLLRKWNELVGGVIYDLVLSPGINCLHPDVVIVHALFYRLKELALEQPGDATAKASFARRIHRRAYYALLSRLEEMIYRNHEVTLAAVSGRTAAILAQRFGRHDVPVIPNAVDTSQFCPHARLARRSDARARRGFHQDELVLLLIGNDWRTKGLPTVLEAMAHLSDASVRLVVVGSEDPEPFRAQAERLGLTKHCLWEQPRADVLEFYAAADVYVSPSAEDSFGLPVAEAMACGLLAITTEHAGVAELLHHGLDSFVLRDARSPQELAALIRRIGTEAELRSKIGEAAAKTALDWSWETHARAIWELLQVKVSESAAAS